MVNPKISYCVCPPFLAENLCLMISGEISTRYRDRENSYDGIARYIKAAVEQKTGNYIVYFPSFEYLNNVLRVYEAAWPEDYIIMQHNQMDDDERKAFLEEFAEMPKRTMIALLLWEVSFLKALIWRVSACRGQ